MAKLVLLDGEVDPSDLLPLAATLFHPATNSIDLDDELEWQQQHFQVI